MNDGLIIDQEIDNFIGELHKRYLGAQVVMDKRKDINGIMYLYLIGLSVRKEFRGEGVAEVHAWACNIFGTDLNTWVPFLEEMGFVKIDDDNNLVYFPKK